MTLKVWNAGEQVLHGDLNSNFAGLDTSQVTATANAAQVAATAAQTAATLAGAWQRIGSDTLAAGMSAIAYTLPSGFIQFRLEWTGLYTNNSSAGILYANFSTNGPSSFDNGSHYNYGLSAKTVGGSEVYLTGSGNTTYIPLSKGQTGQQSNNGYLTFNVGTGNGRLESITGSLDAFTEVSGPYAYTQSYPNAITLGIAAASFVQGSVRLLGWKSL